MIESLFKQASQLARLKSGPVAEHLSPLAESLLHAPCVAQTNVYAHHSESPGRKNGASGRCQKGSFMTRGSTARPHSLPLPRAPN